MEKKKLDAETNEKIDSKETPTDCLKETKYCKLLQSAKMEDKDFTYAMERIYIKDLGRDEIRLCLYKNMRDRSGSISKRILARPLDLTEMEFIKLFELGIKEKLFSDEFVKYLKNIVNQK